VSDWFADDVAAVLAGVEHPEIAVGPADGLDELLGGLLDLQDDLARVVVWMAENWSADLPVPSRLAAGPGPLDLHVQCRDVEELDRVADLLELHGDPAEHSDDATGWGACRRFGTVLVEVWCGGGAS
jgi:hypothetical protein